ncbi:MAG: hypothetical protein Q9O62_03165 [Ardenticatenia bacterium]|nr:hypothetical protein [Ardenticatenia bacterium]
MGIELSNPILQNSEPVQKVLAYVALYSVLLVVVRKTVWPIVMGIIARSTLKETLRALSLRALYLLLVVLLLLVALFSILTITGGEFVVDVSAFSPEALTERLPQLDLNTAALAAILLAAMLILFARLMQLFRRKK